MGLRGDEVRGDQKYPGAAKPVESRTWTKKGPKNICPFLDGDSFTQDIQRVLGIRQVQVQNLVFLPSGPHLRIKENLFYNIS